jgi:hypothetical protein
MTLTRATLGNRTKRKTKDIEIDGDMVRIQKPTPLEFSQYQMALMDADGKPNVSKFADAILLLTARMWIDDEGKRLFADDEVKSLGSIDLEFYQQLSEQCQQFAQMTEASRSLGESEQITASDSPVESALN